LSREIQPNEFPSFINGFLSERVALSHAQGKPLVVEEFGCCLAAPYKGRRLEMFRHYLAAFEKNNVAGQMVWQLFPNGCPLVRDTLNYDFTYSSDAASAQLLMDQSAKYQN
jgi:mannan endo-1,4-beta-mannosidase